MKLGKTNLTVNKNGFGALPIQRRNTADSVEILRYAYDNGINFFDSARYYTDSEDKIGEAFEDVRENIYLASKTQAEEVEEFHKDLETSLKSMKTDYIDLYQFHNISFCPKKEDELYQAMLEAKNEGKIKHIGITTHKITIAHEAIKSRLYETLHYPFSYLSREKEISLVKECKKTDIGFIAMKAMGGGLITNSKASYAYINQFDNVQPIWGIQKLEELKEFLSYDENTVLTQELKNIIEKDKRELKEEFCRGCGYCMPCPQKINISMCARMSLWIRRFPSEPYLTEEYQNMMNKTGKCTQCQTCISKCPYELNIPRLLKENYHDYMNILNNTEVK